MALIGANWRSPILSNRQILAVIGGTANWRLIPMIKRETPTANWRQLAPIGIFGAKTFGANMFGANWRQFGANVLGANVFGANVFGANVFGANVFGANVFGAKLAPMYLVSRL